MYSYGDYINDQLSISCYYLGLYEEGINYIKEVLKNPIFADSYNHYMSNLKHFARQMGQENISL
jgi:hypothetical protein